MAFSDFCKTVAGKRVLFIATSDAGYIRNSQEIGLLENLAGRLDIIAPQNTNRISPTGVMRILSIGLRVIWADFKKYDAIFIGGLPQFIVPIVKMRSRKKALVIDFFISIYDTLVYDRKIISPSNPFSRVLKKLDANALLAADHVIVDTHGDAEFFSRTFGSDRAKMTVLYLEADKKIYHPPLKMEKPPELESKFVVFFFGAMNPLQGAEVILESARILEKNGNIIYIIIGPCEKIKGIDRYLGLTNVRFAAKWLSQAEIADLIAISDVCLAGHFNAAVEKASRVIPGKAFSYMAMERPVIFGDNPANRELFPVEEKGVYFVRMGDPAALADKILELAGGKV